LKDKKEHFREQGKAMKILHQTKAIIKKTASKTATTCDFSSMN
jgi:hypothetical protein